MKRISLLLALGTLGLAQAQALAGPSHPASKEWVLQQLADLRSSIVSDRLSAIDWTNLCPAGQSIDSTTGCTPNCSGAQAAACTRILASTEVEDQTLLSSTAATGLSVFRLTVQPTFANAAPTFTNASLNNNIRCQTFTVQGRLLHNLNDNFLLADSSDENDYQQFTAGVDLSINTATNNNMLSVAPDTGSQRLNQQYYVICLAYTTTANVATNVNMDGTLTITWN